MIYFSGNVLPLVQDILAKPELMLTLTEAADGHVVRFQGRIGAIFRFTATSACSCKIGLRSWGAPAMNYFLWGHMFGCPCSLTGLGNIWPQVELDFYQHLENGRRDEALGIVLEKGPSLPESMHKNGAILGLYQGTSGDGRFTERADARSAAADNRGAGRNTSPRMHGDRFDGNGRGSGLVE